MNEEIYHTKNPSKWTVQHSIPPWKQGTSLFRPGDMVIEGTTLNNVRHLWNGQEWDIFDIDGFETIEELVEFWKN
jgi:hypothetical protein